MDWWHDLEGGPIAEARPPPPGADAPYPNLANVPVKPKPDDQSLRGGVATRLLADRASAQYAVATVPLTVAPPPAPPPAPAAPGDQSEALGATLQAAASPPSPPAPAPPPAASAPAATVVAAATVPLPPIPADAPPPPVITGLGVAAITAPTPPLRAPPPVIPAPVVIGGKVVTVPFTGGSAVPTVAAQVALRQLARRRGTFVIVVIGYGEAASSDPPIQSAALPLAWERAQAIAGTLRQAGVPAGMMRLSAEATGTGGVATIAD